MKTDREVLEEAIEILSQDGGWCQGQFVDKGEDGKLSFCAEGAIMKAIGYHVVSCWNGYEEQLVLSLSPEVRDGKRGETMEELELEERALHLRQIVAKALPAPRPGDNGPTSWRQLPRWFNDAESTTKEDMILAMKTALEEMGQ